ncbi:hypothetical protein MVEN_01536100 [Mycena venus]|uniref:Elongator complex protein 5 n=1 Tax=Mycena venus TaxID=2733690 RepID=A0A8H7CTT2_9AGAR|nr:hypothetical protein MVEN_01536100 [Mycena venus]
MASAAIRPIKDSDEKLVRFMVAKANMESLAAANRQGAFLSFARKQPPNVLQPIITHCYLQPLPGFATIFVPLMFAIDWINRPYFENLTQDALRAPDMRGNIKEHYEKSPASGFFIVEYDEKFVGLIAIDASIENDVSTKHSPNFILVEYKCLSFANHVGVSNLFLLLQSSIAQSSIAILCQLLEDASSHALLFCLLHPSLLSLQGTDVQVYDLLDNVPGYNDNYEDPRRRIHSAVENAPAGPLDFVVDSVDTLASDIGSIAETYKFLSELLSLIRARSSPSRLIVHALSPSALLPLLCQPGFSPSLTHVISHPPALLRHLSTEYLILPPPLSPEAKFWGIFLPVSERVHESERLIFGAEGEGTGDGDELVIETVVDPTQNVSFNLNLTASQQNSRAQVPLPYVHEGRPLEKQPPTAAAIFYDPDSADDIDDDDPDEDLDI